jgi:hypothetical protein
MATFLTWVSSFSLISTLPRIALMLPHPLGPRNVWEPIETQGQVPSARCGHSCCPSPASTKEFILFGGHGVGNKHYNELHFFNTGNNVLSSARVSAKLT